MKPVSFLRAFDHSGSHTSTSGCSNSSSVSRPAARSYSKMADLSRPTFDDTTSERLSKPKRRGVAPSRKSYLATSRQGFASVSRYRMLVWRPSVVVARRRRPSWSVAQLCTLPGFSAIISISPLFTSTR